MWNFRSQECFLFCLSRIFELTLRMVLILHWLSTLQNMICERLIKTFFFDAFITSFWFFFIYLKWVFISHQISALSPPNLRESGIETLYKKKKKSSRRMTISSTKLMISSTGDFVPKNVWTIISSFYGFSSQNRLIMI